MYMAHGSHKDVRLTVEDTPGQQSAVMAALQAEPIDL